ncbi:MAG: sensor signal transduction histidine kinase [Deltaproteobacteria bacterium]|nr:sensor signal transduction histidine kinase [Deltaproteobacteria bacterium]
MQSLTQIITEGEAALVERVMLYADRMGYAKYTPLDPEIWKIAIHGLSAGLTAALQVSAEIPELSPDPEFIIDRITAFGVEQARKHRSRGVSLEMFLGLMKYFRQSYLDLLDDSTLASGSRTWAHTYVERYFDRIELGFISEWERAANKLKLQQEQLLLAQNSELSAANGRLQQEIIDRKKAERQIKRLNSDLERRVATNTLQLQRILEQNNYKLKELLLLNRFSSLNLSTIRLNRLSHIILATLTSEPLFFFERAMLLLLNEKAEVLQGMLGVMSREESTAHLPADFSFITDTEMNQDAGSPLSQELKSSRITLKKGRGIFYRVVTEKRVLALHARSELEAEAAEFCSRFNCDSFAVMPLMGKKRVFGVIIVDNPQTGRRINRNDLKFLQLFANHVGIAVENLTLFTNLEDANRRIQEAQEQLIHGERLATIGELSAGIAHELKGPMIAIGGFARRLARKIPAGSQEAGYITTIIEEEQRLEKMLDEVLSFSRKTTLCYQRCSITETVDGALAILEHAVEKNRVQLLKSFPKKEIMLYGDCQQLKQVFINLFHNALDVMHTGGVLKVSITAAQLGKRKAAVIRISDTGCGISTEMKNSIFSPFFTTKSNGTGLGLPIANRIVANHGGKIRVRNHAAGGAEFTVLLPCEA